MPIALPAPARRRIRVLTGALALVAAFALWPAPAHAFTVQVSRPFERGGRLWVTTALEDPFDARVVQGLQGGVPITVAVRAELWRHRRGWFDRQEASFGAVMRIGYESLKDRYRVERSGEATAYFHAVDSLARYVTRPWSMPLASLGTLRTGGAYYVTVHATLKPLTLEDAAEVEDWLAGAEHGGPAAGFGMLASLPRALFEAARSVAGFGDRQARAASEDYSRP